MSNVPDCYRLLGLHPPLGEWQTHSYTIQHLSQPDPCPTCQRSGNPLIESRVYLDPTHALGDPTPFHHAYTQWRLVGYDHHRLCPNRWTNPTHWEPGLAPVIPTPTTPPPEADTPPPGDVPGHEPGAGRREADG